MTPLPVAYTNNGVPSRAGREVGEVRMNQDEFETYLGLISRLLRLNRTQQDTIGDELRDHMELRVAELIKSGAEPHQATRQALEEFGDAASFAKQFESVFLVYRRRWMIRFMTFSIAGTFLVGLFIFSIWPDNARFGSPSTSIAQDSSGDQEAETKQQPLASSLVDGPENKIRNILERVVSLSFEDKPFQEIMEILRGDYGINVILDHSAKEDSLDYDEPVKFQCQDIRLGAGLDLMLLEKNATFMIRCGNIVVYSRDESDNPYYFDRRIINVRSLLEKIEKFEKLSDLNNQQPGIQVLVGSTAGHFNQTNGGGFGGGGFGGGGRPGSGGGGGVFQIGASESPTTPQNDKLPQNDAAVKKLTSGTSDTNSIVLSGPVHVAPMKKTTAEQRLIDLIQRSIAANSWADAGGGEATIMIVGGLLVVNNSRSSNDQIQDLVNGLYRMMN